MRFALYDGYRQDPGNLLATGATIEELFSGLVSRLHDAQRATQRVQNQKLAMVAETNGAADTSSVAAEHVVGFRSGWNALGRAVRDAGSS